MRLTLPLFLTRRNKIPLSLLWVVIGGTLYLSSNHFPIHVPQELPLTAWDRTIPFVPWTVWIYSSEMFLFFFVYLLSRDLVNTNKYLYSILALQIVSVTIFFFWPTTYPRGEFPLPSTLDPLTYHLFNNLRNVDTAGNCLPSLHVSSCFLSSFVYIDEQREKFPLFFLWSLAIAVSTLTTKQHYIIDVVAGIGLAVVMYLIFHRAVKYRPAPSLEQSPVAC